MGKYKWDPIFTFKTQLNSTVEYTGFSSRGEEGIDIYFNVTPEMHHTERFTGVHASSWRPKIEEFASKQAAKFTGLKPKDFLFGWHEGPNRTLVLRTGKKPLKTPPNPA